MLNICKRLALGGSLLVVASAGLPVSDGQRRPAPANQGGSDSGNAPGSGRVIKLALLQMASQPIMEDGAAGVLAGLAERGYVDGKNLQVRRLNAEGDTAVVNTMAQEVTGGGYDL